MVANDSWREDLETWLAPFLADLTHPAQRRMCPAYIAGLIGPGDRKVFSRWQRGRMMSATISFTISSRAGHGTPCLSKAGC